MIPTSIAERECLMFLGQAAQDYSAARCLLMHGLFSGFILAQQGVEKTLKAYLYSICNGSSWTKEISHQSEVVPQTTHSHDLLRLSALLRQKLPVIEPLLLQHKHVLEKLTKDFDRKYPNSKIGKESSTTGELREIDALMIGLTLMSLWIPSASSSPGVLHAATPLVIRDQPDAPWQEWIRRDNQAFAAALPKLGFIIQAEFRTNHPQQADLMLLRI